MEELEWLASSELWDVNTEAAVLEQAVERQCMKDVDACLDSFANPRARDSRAILLAATQQNEQNYLKHEKKNGDCCFQAKESNPNSISKHDTTCCNDDNTPCLLARLLADDWHPHPGKDKALDAAVKLGNVAAVTCLLKHNAIPTTSTLSLAIQHAQNAENILELLWQKEIKATIEPQQPLLQLAIQHKDIRIVQMMTRTGMDHPLPDLLLAIQNAAFFNKYDIFCHLVQLAKTLYSEFCVSTPCLLWACCQGLVYKTVYEKRADQLSHLINLGVRVPRLGLLLDYAIQHHAIQQKPTSIPSSAENAVFETVLRMTGCPDFSHVLLAIKKNKPELAKFCLHAMAPIIDTEKHQEELGRVLDTSIQHNAIHLVLFLLETYGEDCVDEFQTALCLASEFGRQTIIKIFLDRNRTLRCHQALCLACEKRHVSVAHMLLNWMASNTIPFADVDREMLVEAACKSGMDHFLVEIFFTKQWVGIEPFLIVRLAVLYQRRNILASILERAKGLGVEDKKQEMALILQFQLWSCTPDLFFLRVVKSEWCEDMLCIAAQYGQCFAITQITSYMDMLETKTKQKEEALARAFFCAIECNQFGTAIECFSRLEHPAESIPFEHARTAFCIAIRNKCFSLVKSLSQSHPQSVAYVEEEDLASLIDGHKNEILLFLVSQPLPLLSQKGRRELLKRVIKTRSPSPWQEDVIVQLANSPDLLNYAARMTCRHHAPAMVVSHLIPRGASLKACYEGLEQAAVEDGASALVFYLDASPVLPCAERNIDKMLVLASKSGWTDLVAFFLKFQTVSPQAKRQALDHAAFHDHYQIAALILDSDASILYDTAMAHVCRYKHVQTGLEIVKRIPMDCVPSAQKNAWLLWALVHGSVALYLLLEKRGAVLPQAWKEKKPFLKQAFLQRRIRMIDLLMETDEFLETTAPKWAKMITTHTTCFWTRLHHAHFLLELCAQQNISRKCVKAVFASHALEKEDACLATLAFCKQQKEEEETRPAFLSAFYKFNTYIHSSPLLDSASLPFVEYFCILKK